MKSYRVAIIGTGAIANTHMDALRAAGNRVEVLAAVDVNQDNLHTFCAKYGIPQAYTDVDEMLSTVKPDLVHICTPPAIHQVLIIKSLEAGAWVLCEKPLCASLAEFDQITAVEAQTGRYVSTIFQWRFGAAAQHLKRLMNTNELGRPLIGLCQTLWYRDLAYYQVPWRGKWATEVGGSTVGHGIHLMDLFLWLMGDWQEVQAVRATMDHPIEVEDVSMALVRFENQALGNITNSVVSPRQESYVRMDFQRATVELSALYSYTNANWTYSVPDGSPDVEKLSQWQTIDGEYGGNHTSQLLALLDNMDRSQRPLVSGDEARRILEFIASLYKSSSTGQWVTRGSITADDPFYYSMNGAAHLKEQS
jgi:predicted dehydrogenase